MFCHQCGKEVSQGGKYCAFCGAELKKIEQPSNDSKASNLQGQEQSEPIQLEEAGKVKSGKSKKIAVGIGIGLGILIGLVLGAFFYFQSQAKSWGRWTANYEKEIESYYLSDEEKADLEEFMTQAEAAKHKKEQEALKKEMTNFKEQIADENKKYIEEIEAGLSQLESGYDLTYAYDDEITNIENMKEEIQKLKESKDYPRSLEKIEACKRLEESIQTVKTGWDVSVVQRDISQYPKVKLYLDVRDELGNPVEKLAQKIFFLSQKEATDGSYVKKQITSAMQLNQNESLNMNLVADVSGSMHENMPAVKSIMNNFLNTVQFGVGDQIALTQFSDTSYVSQNFTSDKNKIASQINDMSADGGTKLYDTLIEAVLRVYGQSGAKCVIAFTDGYDNRSVSSPDEVIRIATQCGIPIFIIGIGYDVDNSLLSYIASSTGGYYTNALNISSMQEIYNSIYTAQKQVYCVEYQADHENMKDIQDIQIYLRGENAGGTVTYSYTPSDDFFDILLNNYLNSYIEALIAGDVSIMKNAGYASLDGGVYAETSAYIQKNKDKLSEQLLQAEVTEVKYIDPNTYEITSNETYDIQWLRNYDQEVASDTSEESMTVKGILSNDYDPMSLMGRMIKVYKSRTLKGHYKVQKSAEGKWQITDFTGNYEALGTNIYNAHIDGDE